MLVTFSTKVSPDITLFGEVAIELLRHMGQTGIVPGALLGPDIPPALARLRQAIALLGARPSGNPPPEASVPDEAQDESRPVVSLRQRAVPLVQLLEAAAARGEAVTWRQV